VTRGPASATPPDERREGITRKTGWFRYAEAADRQRPVPPDGVEIADLRGRDRLLFNEVRAIWHANIGPIRTPQVAAIHADMHEIFGAARQDGHKVKPAMVIDAPPGLGKIGNRAANCMISTGTRLMIIDDVHFLELRSKAGRDIANHFKWIANTFPVTLLLVGVDLRKRGLFDDPQTARRWTPLEVAAQGNRERTRPDEPHPGHAGRGRHVPADDAVPLGRRRSRPCRRWGRSAEACRPVAPVTPRPVLPTMPGGRRRTVAAVVAKRLGIRLP